MNATITRIVDILFQDTEMNEEVQALHDEILRNCQDRYEDQLAQGKSEDEATATVVDSLKGMEEVIGSYPKKAAAAHEPHRTEEAGNADVRCLRVDLRDQDVVLRESADSRFTMFADAGGVELHQEGDTLVVTPNAVPEGKDYATVGWGWLNQMFSFGGRGGTVTLGIPKDRAVRLELHLLSGDVQAQDVTFTEARINTTSGDVRLDLTDRPAMSLLNVQTSSGDLTVRANGEKAMLRSMSGDVTFRGTCKDLEVTSASGDAEVSGDLIEARVKSVSGDVRVEDDFGHLVRLDAVSTSGDVDVNLAAGTAPVHAQLRSISGDVRSKFTDAGPEAPVQVNAKSISGDVRLR